MCRASVELVAGAIVRDRVGSAHNGHKPPSFDRHGRCIRLSYTVAPARIRTKLLNSLVLMSSCAARVSATLYVPLPGFWGRMMGPVCFRRLRAVSNGSAAPLALPPCFRVFQHVSRGCGLSPKALSHALPYEGP